MHTDKVHTHTSALSLYSTHTNTHTQRGKDTPQTVEAERQLCAFSIVDCIVMCG